ncbi:hypothetical protein [Armatimonas sp.]|uniref:hypothetical protein n=1 Tax=Armatimonas sp. TaxID=1872638 RepID=UPI00286B64C0|nr:hypothetical protein [Armatimonas sp.]
MRLKTVAAEEPHTSYRILTAPALTQTKPRELYDERTEEHQAPTPQSRQVKQKQQSKGQKRELPQMRFVVLALVGIFLVPWFPTKANPPAPRIPHESANRLYAQSQKHFDALRSAAPGQSWQGKRLSQLTPADKKAWTEWAQRKPT